MSPVPSPRSNLSLDPDDWTAFGEQSERMLARMVAHIEGLADAPVRKPIPEAARHAFRSAMPREGADLVEVFDLFERHILPYGAGNAHPRFLGWVQGGGTPVGMLAEMLAAGLNANLGGRDQIPLEVERQVSRWVADLFGFPEDAGGLFVTGASIANFIALLVARTDALGRASRETGLGEGGAALRGYTSVAAHGCVRRAFEMSGLGANALRLIPVDEAGRMDPRALLAAIHADKAAGLRPFLVVAAAGTVDTGAIDPLGRIAEIAADEGLWFHIDGAVGALGMLSPNLAPRFAGIEKADSIAFDFHKWGQAPYDAGFLLVRRSDAQLETFGSDVAYLQRGDAGLFAGSPWPCDFGPDLSRGFRALKVWFTLQVHGAEALGRVVEKTCRLAERLAERIDRSDDLERLAPVALNIVCFRYRTDLPAADLDELNRRIVVALQEEGSVVLSTTKLQGRLAMRAAFVNHRTTAEDVDAAVAAVRACGERLRRDFQA